MNSNIEKFLNNRNNSQNLPKRLYDSLEQLCQNLKNYRSSIFSIDCISFHDSLVLVKQSLSKQSKSLKYLLTHDNEITAKESAYYALEHYGGELYQIVNAEERNLQILIQDTLVFYDPNRIFTKRGLFQAIQQENPQQAQSIQQEAIRIIQIIAQEFLKTMKIPLSKVSQTLKPDLPKFESTQIQVKPFVLALHNNSPSSDLSVDFFLSFFSPDSFAIHKNPKQHSKNFFYVISREAFSFFREKNYNTVLQKEHDLCDDGSLSIWMSQNSLEYINIEAQEGEISFQKEMVTQAIEYWNSLNSGYTFL